MGNSNGWVPFYPKLNVPQTNYYNFCRIDLLYRENISQDYSDKYEDFKLIDYIQVVRYMIDHKVEIPNSENYPPLLQVYSNNVGNVLEGEK